MEQREGNGRSEFYRRLVWLIGLRAALVTILLGLAVLVHGGSGTLPGDRFFLLIGLTYALSGIYGLTLRFVERHRWLADLQLVNDVLIVTAFVATTGGVTSHFTSLYVLPIIAASILQSRRGGITIAGLTVAGYVATVVTQYTSTSPIIPSAWPLGSAALLPSASVAQYTVGLNVGGFLLVAVLSGSLAEGLKRAGASLERASSEIADLQLFNEHVIESLTSGLVTTDADEVILTFNRAAETITGLPGLEVRGRPIGEVLQLPAEFVDELKGKGGHQTNPRLDYMFSRGDGGKLEVGLSATRLLTGVGQGGFLFTFQDVTRSKKLERELRIQQRLAAVGEMAASIAHEIRNPLASMSGSIQILRDELTLSDEQAQLMDIVLRESERLNGSIQSLLSYARPHRFASARMDVAAVVRDTVLLLRNGSEVGAGQEVELDVPPGPIWYEADEGQVRQVIWNLATNGLRAMPDGGRLRIEAGTRGGGVYLSVRDHGVGMASADVDDLFQPFRGTFARGSGLGLAIVHRIVSDYGGTVEVDSRVGQGTTVTIWFPTVVMANTA